MTRTRLPFWGALAALFCVGVIAAFGGGSGSAAEKAGTVTQHTVSDATTTAEEPTVPQTTVQQTTSSDGHEHADDDRAGHGCDQPADHDLDDRRPPAAARPGHSSRSGSRS